MRDEYDIKMLNPRKNPYLGEDNHQDNNSGDSKKEKEELGENLKER